LDIIIKEHISTWTYPGKNQSVWIDWMVSIIRQMVSGVPAQVHKAGARGVARGGVSVWISAVREDCISWKNEGEITVVGY
jgi:hypothetical protein